MEPLKKIINFIYEVMCRHNVVSLLVCSHLIFFLLLNFEILIL